MKIISKLLYQLTLKRFYKKITVRVIGTVLKVSYKLIGNLYKSYMKLLRNFSTNFYIS